MLKVNLIIGKYLFLLLFVVLPTLLKAQVVFNANQYEVDEWKKLVVCNQIPISIAPGTSYLMMDKKYNLSSNINKIEKGDVLVGYNSGRTYEIHFTELPIIKLGVSSLEAINSKSEIGGLVEIAESSGEYYESSMGIRIRGASSSGYPKKSYRVQLKDDLGNNKDTTLFGLRSDKRWLFLAMYNEPLRVNNRVSHELWLDMHKLYYQDDEPKANSTIRTVYAEVFVKGNYRGVYLIGEDIDRKQYQLKKTKEDGTIRGELYKGDGWGNTEFEELPELTDPNAEIWGGWEYKYPDEIDWTNLYNFTDFVVNSEDTEFKEEIGSKLRLDNASDYLLFLNLVMAYDNRGKNTFLAKYTNDEPYFIGVWDLDGTLGYLATSDKATDYTSFLKYGLYDRLIQTDPDQFKKRTAGRWFNLRDGIFHLDSLNIRVMNHYNYLLSNKVYNREQILWSTYYSNSEINYMKNWIANRVNYLDSYFSNWITDCNAPILSIDNESFTNGESVVVKSSECFGTVNWFDSPTASAPIFKGGKYTVDAIYNKQSIFASCKIGSCESDNRSQIELNPNCSDKKINFENGNQIASEYKSEKAITSKAIVSENTIYLSESLIELLPGFSADAGVNFKAEVGGCD